MQIKAFKIVISDPNTGSSSVFFSNTSLLAVIDQGVIDCTKVCTINHTVYSIYIMLSNLNRKRIDLNL